jgi:hypothetical protein
LRVGTFNAAGGTADAAWISVTIFR